MTLCEALRPVALAGLAILVALSPASAQQADHDDAYAFERFIGEWKLKDDRFQQVWDGQTLETLSIPGHRTNCEPVNTSQSILCMVDAVDFEGHILWTVEDNQKTVSHLSSFGSSRIGRGTGSLDEDGNLSLSIAFADEPEGTYRQYTYVWKSDDEYEMVSTQYSLDGEPTGNWYAGSFVRLTKDDQ